jgi:hypothetical protein
MEKCTGEPVCSPSLFFDKELVTEYFEASDNTIRNWNQKYLKPKLKEPYLDNVQYLLIDEKSIGKWHSYVTIVLNAL